MKKTGVILVYCLMTLLQGVLLEEYDEGNPWLYDALHNAKSSLSSSDDAQRQEVKFVGREESGNEHHYESTTAVGHTDRDEEGHASLHIGDDDRSDVKTFKRVRHQPKRRDRGNNKRDSIVNSDGEESPKVDEEEPVTSAGSSSPQGIESTDPLSGEARAPVPLSSRVGAPVPLSTGTGAPVGLAADNPIQVLLNQCCYLGRQWYAQSRERCTAYPTPIRTIRADDQMTCSAIIQICCLEQRRLSQCARGKSLAKVQRRCSSLHSQSGNEDAKECCSCCNLGLAMYDARVPCEMHKFSNSCNNLVTECCNGQKKLDGSKINNPPEPTRAPRPIVTTNMDECAKFPGQLCAHICVNTDASYRCECHQGFRLRPDGRTCQQIQTGNRCDLNNPCQHKCEDTGVAVVCSCFKGFRLQTDMKTCRDIDECRTGTHNCRRNQRCVNNMGSFTCRERGGLGLGIDCGTGFRYNTGTRECEDVNECSTSANNCVEGQICENTIGSFTCRRSIACGTGYTIDRATQKCVDDDECKLNTHNCGQIRECRNTPGSFRCVLKRCPSGYKLNRFTGRCTRVQCNPGYKPDIRGTCVDVNECTEQASVCGSHEECINTVGSYRCQSLVTCGSGYELNPSSTRCVDINECARRTHDCHGNQRCINRPGSYVCQCPEGYQMNRATSRCEDVDECSRFSGQACALNSDCQNTMGSYRCVCKAGFRSKQSDRNTCEDIDECKNRGICQHTCRNIWGSYHCSCYEGYKLGSDKRTCVDIDECELFAGHGGRLCLGVCNNVPGSYTCSCPRGYRMLGDGRTCRDIDECATGAANCNGPDDLCINTQGSYKCNRIQCPKGFVKAPSRGNSRNSVRCQRVSFVCPQGDTECLYAPLSYSENYITFPQNIRIPADLFTMRGPRSSQRRLDFTLKLNSAVSPVRSVKRVGRNSFKLRRTAAHEAVVSLINEVEGPQDINLQLNMNIYSRERSNDEIFFGTAVANITIYVTGKL